MAAQMDLAGLRKAVEKLGHKMDKQMIMVQGLFDLVTSTAPQLDMGLVKGPSQVYHPLTVGVKLCSGDMFKDLAELHEVRTHSKEDVDSLFTTIAKGEDMLSDEFSPKGKTMQPVDEDMCCNCKARGPALNSQSGRQNQPRTFSCFAAPLASVYEKLLDAGSIKPLNPTSLPKNPSANFKYNLYCTYHQMPGHSTNACFRLRHTVQDLIDYGIIITPPPSTADVNQVQNTRSFRARTQPRSFSAFGASLSTVMEKLVNSGHLKPLTPTSPPKVLLASYNANHFCAFHQMHGHLTVDCPRL
ncbi:hypothetical protein RHMOL_Rhmol01G0151800 [Rhododendron molle]|uniref:Uncharacterized protein n=1 Tax=Rhododendron molle TaxID=49168 RepID=A0ACC0Q1E9_RHOML|nr:hypothetical protein RHMOL_Rhmol01G0151800 [Rhododendron molle]